MKFNVVAAVVAAAALAEAAPLRVLMISSGPMSPPPMIERARFGHGIPLPPDVARLDMPQEGHRHYGHPNSSPSHGMRRPCGGRMGAFKAKALQISNAFRQALGLPSIEPDNVHPMHMHHVGEMQYGKIIPTVGTPTFINYKMVDGQMQAKTKGGESLKVKIPEPPSPFRHMGNERDSFLDRLQFSLNNLGLWESAAMSFVFGCGIGVLLRLFYVLTIVAFRSMKGRNDDEVEYTRVTVIQDYEDVEDHPTSPPPTYAYPIDEKHAEEVDAKVAPASN